MKPHFDRPDRLLVILALIAASSAGTAHAQDTIITEENSEVFTKSYIEVAMVDQTFAICQELAPDYANANQAIMEDFSARHSIDQARVILDSAVKNQPDLKQALAGPVDKIMKPLKEALSNNSDLCRDDFAAMLARATPQATPAFMEQLGINVATGRASTETADSDAKKKASDDVVDELNRSNAKIGAVTTPWLF